MTPVEFKAVRKNNGLTQYEWGRALGYAGTRDTIRAQMHKFETGAREIKPWIARLAEMYRRHGVPKEFLPDHDAGGQMF